MSASFVTNPGGPSADGPSMAPMVFPGALLVCAWPGSPYVRRCWSSNQGALPSTCTELQALRCHPRLMPQLTANADPRAIAD
jgi:hypothetical protein